MVGPLHASKLVSSFKLTSSSRLPTDSIITSPDKTGVFNSFSYMIVFLSSSVVSYSPGICSLASLAAGFDTCENKGGYEEEEGKAWGADTGLFNLTSSSGLPTDSIITSPDKSGVFTSFYYTKKFLPLLFPPLLLTHLPGFIPFLPYL